MTLFLFPTTIGEPDSGSRTLVRQSPGPDSLVIWISSQTQQKYTVVNSGLIRSLLATSHTNPTGIETSDGRSGYRGQYPPPRLDLGPDGRLASTQGIRISDWSQSVMYLTTEIYLTYYTEFPSLIGPYPSVYWSIHTPSPDYGLSHTNIPVQFYMYMVLFFTFQSRLRHISHHNESRIYLLFTRQIH